MLIPINQEHIDQGSRGSRSSCPVAISIRELLGLKLFDGGLQVLCTRLKLSNGKSRTLMLPKKAQKFIHAFDRGQMVAPFKFELNI